VFSYSERPDTHAVTLGGRVPHEERARRSRMLRILSEKKRHAFYEAEAGAERRVLFEAKQEGDLITGFSENHVRIGVPYDAALANTLQPVLLGAVEGDLVRGTLLSRDAAARRC
jgi:threonylcarbamoyladenosine tRNA methylthiotransferase MtaB